MAISDWLTLNAESGSGSKEVSGSASENTAFSACSTTFKVKTASGIEK